MSIKWEVPGHFFCIIGFIKEETALVLRGSVTYPFSSFSFFNKKIYDQRLKNETCDVYEKIKIGWKAWKLGSITVYYRD